MLKRLLLATAAALAWMATNPVLSADPGPIAPTYKAVPVEPPREQQQQEPGRLLPGQLDAGPGRFFFIPPPGETRFVSNQLVIYSNVPLSDLQQIAAELDLTIISSQTVGLLGQTTYELQINGGNSVADIIRRLVGYQAITGAAPQYRSLTQDASREGNPGQYVLEKYKLPEVDRTLHGDKAGIAI